MMTKQKRNKKTSLWNKINALVIIVAMLMVCIPAAAQDPQLEKCIIDLTAGTGTNLSTGDTWTLDEYVYLFGDNIEYEITGTAPEGTYIEVGAPDWVNITLNNASITKPSEGNPPLLANADVRLTLLGENTLEAGAGCAGLQVENNATLTISAESTGSLTSIGGADGAGIGGAADSDSWHNTGGSIYINGGTITAIGGNKGAGIGSGYAGVQSIGKTSGYIYINGGTVTAIGSSGGTGIGGGASCGGGNIVISGGTIIANSNDQTNRGIGGGSQSKGGTINISGGIITAGAIGGGYRGTAGVGGTGRAGGTITISGGVVTVGRIGGYYVHLNSSIEIIDAYFSMDGDGVVFAKELQANEGEKTSGILFENNVGTFYGTDVSISGNVTIPQDNTLAVNRGQTLTIPNGKTIHNDGTVYNFGTIHRDGEYGTWTGNQPIEGIATLSGSVQISGVPDKSATVTLYKDGDVVAQTTADSDGTYSLIASPDTYQLVVQKENCTGYTKNNLELYANITRDITLFAGKLQGTGTININDLTLIIKAFGSNDPADVKCDLNEDGAINIDDITIVINGFGKGDVIE